MLKKEHLETTKVLEYFSDPESSMPIPAYLKKVLTPKGAWYRTQKFSEPLLPAPLHEYSNIGATLAALAIEGATGMTFDAFTQEHILQPLGMLASGWSNDAIDITKPLKKLYA